MRGESEPYDAFSSAKRVGKEIDDRHSSNSIIMTKRTKHYEEDSRPSSSVDVDTKKSAAAAASAGSVVEQRATEMMRQMTSRLQLSNERFQRDVLHSDGDQYVKSFEPTETKEIQRFLARYGFVCVRTLDRTACDDATRAIVQSVADQGGDAVEPWQWSTYINRLMPEGFSTGVLDGTALADWRDAGGTLGCGDSLADFAGHKLDGTSVQPQAIVDALDFSSTTDHQLLRKLPLRIDRLTHCDALWAARTDPNLYRVFANLLQTSQLFSNVGFVHFMRPRLARPGHLFEDWRAHIKATFWDRPPSADEFGGFYGLQVVSDAPESAGGLELVPGFHQVYGSWMALQQGLAAGGAKDNNTAVSAKKGGSAAKSAAKGNHAAAGFVSSSGRVLLPKKQYANRLVNGNMQRIAVRAGTVIIVDRRLPMRTFCNNSNALPFCALEVSMAPQAINDPALNNTARRLRCLSLDCAIRFTSMPLLTGHFAAVWTRWRREVPATYAAKVYHAAKLSALGQCLIGLRNYDADSLRLWGLPIHCDITPMIDHINASAAAANNNAFGKESGDDDIDFLAFMRESQILLEQKD